MKRFLALVSAVAVCFCSFSFSYASASMESGAVAQDNEISTFASGGSTWYLPDIANVSYQPVSSASSLPDDSSWINVPPTPGTVYTGSDGEKHGSSFFYFPPEVPYFWVKVTFMQTPPSEVMDYFSFDYYVGGGATPVVNAGPLLNFLEYSYNSYSDSGKNDFSSRIWLRTNSPVPYGVLSTMYIRFNFANSAPSFLHLGNFAFSSTTSSNTSSWYSSSYYGAPVTSDWFTDLLYSISSVLEKGFKSIQTGVGDVLTQIKETLSQFFEKSNNNWDTKDYHNSEVDSAISDIEQQDQQMGAVEDKYLGDFNSQQSEMSTTLSTFQWPTDITSGMAWITIQMNTIWTGFGGNIQMLFTFSMILGLGLIFLGRWRA